MLQASGVNNVRNALLPETGGSVASHGSWGTVKVSPQPGTFQIRAGAPVGNGLVVKIRIAHDVHLQT